MHWANEALNDDALDALMRRLFCKDNCLVLSPNDKWSENAGNNGSKPTLDGEGFRMIRKTLVTIEVVTPSETDELPAGTRVRGGVGGFDGRGGLGQGIMYCIEQKWWKKIWENHVGWNWEPDPNVARHSRSRVGALFDEAVAGLYIVRTNKMGMIKGVDYVLVPPNV